MNPNNENNKLHPHPTAIQREKDIEEIRQMFRDMGIKVPKSGFGIGHELGDTGAMLTLGIRAGKVKEELTTDE